LDLAAELQRIYDSEINVRFSWLWDCGFDVRLGNEVNGFVAEEELIQFVCQHCGQSVTVEPPKIQ
jgi:hypothetical protein